MTILVIVPDYASHWYPLAAVSSALRGRGHTVVVATGPALAPRVIAAGLGHIELRLGSSSNTGVPAAGVELDAFFAATRDGMIATLRHQAERRRHDLLWQPHAVAARLREIIVSVEPDVTLVDQLAFGATAALRGLRVPFLSFLPGHPSQLPGRGDTFGFPDLRPPGFAAAPDELRSLRALCTRVVQEFTAAYNRVVGTLDPDARQLVDAFAAGGTLGTLVNYPGRIGTHASRLPHAVFLGSCVRSDTTDPLLTRLARAPRVCPRAYVSLGSFLSVRTDVLRRIADALRLLGFDAIIATGATDPRSLGVAPPGWVLAEHLPQVSALAACDVAVCHGGNNTVTEALTVGLPVLALPFATDQFAGAEDLRRAGLGGAIDPCTATPADIAARLGSLLDGAAAGRAAALGTELRRRPGAERAADVVESARASATAAA